MADEQPRKKRRPNFTAEETMALVSAVTENQVVLFGNLHLDIERNAVSQRENAWQKVTDAVNSISDVERDADEIRTKYKHFKSELKKKWAKEQRQRSLTSKTASSPVTYSAAEMALLQLLAQEPAGETPEAPGINNVLLTVEDVLESLSSGEQLNSTTTAISLEDLSTVNGFTTPVVSTATSATPSPAVQQLPWAASEVGPADSPNQGQVPSQQGTMEEMLAVQREIRDLLKELNSAVATGLRDVAAAIKCVTDRGSHS